MFILFIIQLIFWVQKKDLYKKKLLVIVIINERKNRVIYCFSIHISKVLNENATKNETIFGSKTINELKL